MKGRSCLPNDPKIIVCICFGAFWICNKMLSYGRITFHFRNRVFTHTRWLISCCCVFRPDATQRLADRIKQHVPTSIRTKTTTTREQPPRMCKNFISKMKIDSAIGQHLITNPECAITYTDDNFRIIGQARSSFHLGVLESVYIKTQNPVLCKQKEFVFSLGLFK